MRDDLGQWMNESMEKIHLSKAAKSRLINTLKSGHTSKGKEDDAVKKKWLKKTTVLALAAACIFILVVAASATVLIAPIIRDYYGNSAGYQQSSLDVGKSITKKDWTMTLTDLIADNYNLYAGIELAAPVGTVLDNKYGYSFDELDISFSGLSDAKWGIETRRIKDESLPSNILHFMLKCTFSLDGETIDGRQVCLKLGKIRHHNQYDDQKGHLEWLIDCPAVWKFKMDVALSPDIIRLEPNLPITTLDVKATITNVEVSPFGAYVCIEGDTLKGHHRWVPKNAIDGWYGCVEYQDVSLRLKDGSENPLTGSINSSSCSGGDDFLDEPGSLFLARRSETLIDMDTVQSLFVCGVEIPLQ